MGETKKPWYYLKRVSRFNPLLDVKHLIVPAAAEFMAAAEPSVSPPAKEPPR